MRTWVAVLLALSVLACDKTPAAPTGVAGDVARQMQAGLAPDADIADRPFEEFVSQLDVSSLGAAGPEIVAQIRKTREAVGAARMQGSVSGGSRLARVATSVGAFSITHFRTEFAIQLDDRTAKSGSVAFPFRPFTSTENGANAFTTTTLAVTEIFEGNGSVVTGTVRWNYTTITIDAKSGATILHLTDDRELIGTIDVCPDASGTVPATLRASASIVSTANGVTTTRKANGSTEVKGTVSEQAKLLSVRQTSKNDASWNTAAGDGGYSSRTGATWNNAGSSGFLGGLDVGSITAEVSATGIATAQEAAKAAGWDTVLNAFALDQAFLKAEELWRKGRCVVVTAPDYGAETPLAMHEQEKVQHDEGVDVSSDTKFSVNLKHRFAGSLSQPIVASLTSGQKSITPNRLESAGSVTYKAPDEEDKKATVKLQSTSKRGIGTLVLDFHTAGGLTLTIVGEVKGEQSFFGTVRTLDSVKIGPLEFKKTFGDIWQATGSWTSETSSFTAVGIGTDTCSGKEAGTITMMATLETRGSSRVWVIDPLDAMTDGTGTTTCQASQGDQTLRGATIPGKRTSDTDGGSADLFLGNLERFTIPADGGTVRVHGSSGGGPSGTFTSDGTATAKK